ncbi:uncharacterized protein LOC143470976 isoform X3 [Clavelina lepadiformis]|uniref:uncharacterized protein LOC143470976 isoform X3 n=1 Tax=Clavelina lepadiformis TaxID=159417 RepID=UPI004042204D
MSMRGLDNEFLFALRTPGAKRSERELNVIYSRLHRLEILSGLKEQNLRDLCSQVRYESYSENDTIYRKDDPCHCWYVLMSGSVFIQGSMFLPYQCFGKRIPGTKRRGCQCVVLSSSEMIAIDYPDMPVHAGGLATRPHALRHSISTTLSSSSQSTLDNVAEGDSSSSEGSPLHTNSENNLHNAANGQAVMMTDSISQSSLSKDTDGDDFDDHELDEEDSISLHSTSSLVIKDQVIDVLKKETDDRNQDDLETLMEFTKSLRAFSNMTEPVRRALCNVMIFAWVPKANTIVLKDDELLDSWSVIINGQVQVQQDGDDLILSMGDSFGVSPSLEEQRHKGAMHTITDDCQFLCIAQQQYYDILHQGEENIENIYSEKGDLVLVKEKRESDGTKQGNIVIRGNPEHLMRHLLDENTIDATFAEDFLLTYRAFFNEPLKICRELLRRCDNKLFRDKVTRTILLWVNNHFSDFEGDWRMMELLEEFEEKLNRFNLHGETKLFNIACSAKAKPRSVSFTRSSCEADLGFKILGGSENNFPIYVSQVSNGSTAESKGVKRGDQLMEVNGQNFEKLSHERAQAILKKNTELNLTLKTSLFAFKEMMTELANPQPKTKKDSKFSHSLRRPRVSITNDGEVFDKHKKGGTLGRATFRIFKKRSKLSKKETFFDDMARIGGESQVTRDDNYLVPGRVYTRGSSATIDSFRPIKNTQNISLSNPDLLDPNALEMSTLPEIPEDVIKVYRVDQTCRFIFVSRDTTAGDAVQMACREFGITEEVHNYALYKVSVQGEKFVKQSKLPEPLAKLADMPLGSRYYLKNMMNSEQLLPDENIPELLKEANFSFLDLNCFEVALYLTREDYKLFQLTEPTNFIEDLFGLNTELKKFKQFEDLVNRELFWVVTTLCKEQSVILRSKIVKHFTKIAHHCKLLKNLNSTFALISGLGYRAVSRMKQSWERVPAKSNRLFEELQALMDPSRNMSKYRTLLNEYVSQPPVIPYVPVVKKDLTFLHLGNDTKVDGLINFEKMRMIAKEVRGICRLCAPDHQQILPSAVAAQQKETDRGAYQTLARRGRRSSFNNARRMYEDQMNVRRVRQYMQQIDIISDEDKLMEMSKNVEPSASNSNQMKRPKNNNTLSSDSPSRSSKTLPPQAGRSSSTGSNSSLQSRNNSEPHLNLIPNLTLPATKKKTPSSTLPKYGVGQNSPQLISRKLLALSEEGADERKTGKRGKESKRSASVSSHDFSPSASPFISPRRISAAGVESNHTVGLENTNKNNNRLSLPADMSSEPSPGILSAPVLNKKFFPSNSNTSSSRSSIASASSLGTMSSSNPSTSSLVEHSNSPRSSSPVPWGSSGSLASTATSSPRLLPAQQHRNTNSPARSSSGSSADTVKSVGGRRNHHERPVIMQQKNGRSSSFAGASMMVSAMTDRRLSQISSSTSTPSLNAPGAHAAFILPNHPQISRTPSIDSGVLSAGSLSADSVRFNPGDESEIFARQHPHQQQSSHYRLQQHHRHTEHPSHPADRHIHSSHPPPGSVPHPRYSQQTSSGRQHPENHEETNTDKIEQTFLSGCRGHRDPPRIEQKDPYPTSLPLTATNIAVDRGKFVPEGVAMYHHHQHQASATTSSRAVLSRSIIGKNSRGIQDFLICERHAAIQNYYLRGNTNGNNNVSQLGHYAKARGTTSPEDMLEEQLRLELQKQKPTFQKFKRRNHQDEVIHEHNDNLVDLRRLSLSKSDPSLNNPPEWGPYPDTVDCAKPLGQHGMVPKTSSPKYRIQTQGSMEQGVSPGNDTVFMNHANRFSLPPSMNKAETPTTETRPPWPQNKTPLVNATPPFTHATSNWGNPTPRDFRTSKENLHIQLNSDHHDAPNRTRLNLTLPTFGNSPNEHQMQNRSFQGPYRRGAGTPTASAENSQQRLAHYTSYDGQEQRDSSGSYQGSYPFPQEHSTPNEPLPHPAELHSDGHVIFQQSYQQITTTTTEKWTHSQVRRKTSQEWNETDLDGDKMQQTMRAWGSSTSLPTAPLNTKYTSTNNQNYQLPPRSLQQGLLHSKSTGDAGTKSAGKPPPPPPPQRTTRSVRAPSIGRPKQLQIATSPGSPFPSPPPSPTVSENFEHSLENAMDRYHQSFEAAFPGANGHVVNHASNRMSFASPGSEFPTMTDRRSLPSYNEALNQINAKQNSLFSSPIANAYRPFTSETRESKEQVSQV